MNRPIHRPAAPKVPREYFENPEDARIERVGWMVQLRRDAEAGDEAAHAALIQAQGGGPQRTGPWCRPAKYSKFLDWSGPSGWSVRVREARGDDRGKWVLIVDRPERQGQRTIFVDRDEVIHQPDIAIDVMERVLGLVAVPGLSVGRFR